MEQIQSNLSKSVDSITIDKLFWIQFAESRVSFSFEGLPEGIHFTISWSNPERINFHITKNTGDGTNKPKVDIAIWDTDLVNAFSPYIPSIIINKMYKPMTFGRYSRRDRKNIRIVYFDEVEGLIKTKKTEERFMDIFQKHFLVKRKKLKIKASAGSDIVPFIKQSGLTKVFLDNLRSLKPNSFSSGHSRAGLLFLGNKKHHFITYNNKCMIKGRHMNMEDLFKTFMNARLVKELSAKIKVALFEIEKAYSYNDTIHLNNPISLFLEPSNQRNDVK